MSSGSPSFKKPARLGRGLSALVGTTPPVRVESAALNTAQSANNPVLPESGGLVMVPVEMVRANPNQPRRHFDDDALLALAESIRRDGVMQPVVVRRVVGEGGDSYELVAGERRLRASRLAGLETIPAIVREVDERTSAELALIENLQRADLNPVERALAFRALADRYRMTHAEIGERVGMDRASVSNHLRLLDLDDETLSMVAEGRLGFGHARALLGIADAERRTALARLAAEESWSVRAVERAAAGEAGMKPADAPEPGGEKSLGSTTMQQNGTPARTRARAVLDDMERRLSEHLGTRVTLKTDRTGQKGTLTLEFFSLDQFDGLLDRLGYSHDLS